MLLTAADFKGQQRNIVGITTWPLGTQVSVSLMEYNLGSIVAWAHGTAVSGRGHVEFIDDVNDNRKKRMKSEMNISILFAQTQPNAGKATVEHFKVQMDKLI